jgi:hypothetical protein
MIHLRKVQSGISIQMRASQTGETKRKWQSEIRIGILFQTPDQNTQDVPGRPGHCRGRPFVVEITDKFGPAKQCGSDVRALIAPENGIPDQ